MEQVEKRFIFISSDDDVMSQVSIYIKKRFSFVVVIVRLSCLVLISLFLIFESLENVKFLFHLLRVDGNVINFLILGFIYKLKIRFTLNNCKITIFKIPSWRIIYRQQQLSETRLAYILYKEKMLKFRSSTFLPFDLFQRCR